MEKYVIPELWSTTDEAINIVTYVINKALDKVGNHHLTLASITSNYYNIRNHIKFLYPQSVKRVGKGLEKFIVDLITKKWELTTYFDYYLKFIDTVFSETSLFYYYEAIFSQPTPQYTAPQVTASVFFMFEESHIYNCKSSEKPTPQISWRLEGHYVDHDIRFARLVPEQLMGIMMMKQKMFRKIEHLRLF